MKRVVMVVALATLVSGCATAPEAIAPAYVSEVSYQGWTCRQLSEEQGRLDSAYEMTAQAQHHARTNDTIGIIFLGLPVSSLSGSNVAPQVANLKGQQIAVQRAANMKNCGRTAEAAEPTAVAAIPSPVTTPVQRGPARAKPCAISSPTNPSAVTC